MEWEKLDLISKLPIEVQQRIVSFIPLKEAVRTSILSTSWRSLWIPFQIDLDFDPNKKLIQSISTFFKSSDTPQLWKFHLTSPEEKIKEGSKLKDDLIFSAIKGAENELHLDFSGGKQLMTENFDMKLYQSSTCLKEAACFSLSSLKTLHLRSVNSLANDLVSNLFSKSLLLMKNLKLEKCSGLQSVDIKANAYLESFVMMDCPEAASVKISAPNLKSFWYRGVLPLVQLESSPSLVDVVLDLRGGLGQIEFDCEDVLSLLASLQDIETLTISSWLLEWLCTGGVIFGRLEFRLNKLKELYWTAPLMDQPKRDSLACFLNMLPCLEGLFVHIDQRSGISTPSPFFHQYWHEPHLWMDYEAVKSNASQLDHLKAVKLVGFTDKEDELLLMDLLLKKAFTIKSMLITSPAAGNQTCVVSKIPRSQLKHTMSCYPKRIGISLPKKEYFFGLREEHNNGLCPANGWCF